MPGEQEGTEARDEPSSTEASTSTSPKSLHDVLATLNDVPEGSRTYGCRMLLQCLHHLESVQQYLQHPKPPDEETLVDQERVLLNYLAGYFYGINGTPGIISSHLLEPELIASGMVGPFIVPRPNGAAGFGVPTKLSPDVRCDNRSELLRMAVAAIISAYVYLNTRQGPSGLPADEVVLIFTTVTIHSIVDPEHVLLLDQELQELNGPEGFGCSQIRWLMHYLRLRIMGYMADAYYLLGHKEKHAECFVAMQKDAQFMVKALPESPMGYSLYARQAMNFQGMGLAVALLTKGLAAAQEVNDDSYSCVMCYQKAAALLLGGGGEDFEAEELQQLLEQGEEKRDSVVSWFPAALQDARVDGEPDRTLVLKNLIPEWEKRSGAALADATGRMKKLEGLLYVTKAPDSIPPGALSLLQDAAGEGASQPGGG